MKTIALYNKAFRTKSPTDFLLKYKSELESIEILSSILKSNMYDDNELMKMICQLLWSEVERQQETKTITVPKKEKIIKEPRQKSIPNYTITIFAGDNVALNDDKEMIYTANSMQACEIIADNRMWNRADCTHAEIVAHRLVGKNGAMIFKVSREESLERKLRDKKTPQCKRTHGTSSSLEFGVKAKNDHCYFSRG